MKNNIRNTTTGLIPIALSQIATVEIINIVLLTLGIISTIISLLGSLITIINKIKAGLTPSQKDLDKLLEDIRKEEEKWKNK